MKQFRKTAGDGVTEHPCSKKAETHFSQHILLVRKSFALATVRDHPEKVLCLVAAGEWNGVPHIQSIIMQDTLRQWLQRHTTPSPEIHQLKHQTSAGEAARSKPKPKPKPISEGDSLLLSQTGWLIENDIIEHLLELLQPRQPCKREV